MTSAPRVALVVLNWNGWPLTEACLRSVADLDPAPGVVSVVDNGSTDDSEGRIREAFPHVTVIQTGRNLGFAGGMNAGIRPALAGGADLLWLLNNDTRAEPGALGALVATAAGDPRIGIVGSVLHHADRPGEVQAWGGGSVGRWFGLTELWTERRDGVPDYVTGASMLVRREVFEQVGLFDEGYFLYFEDVDLCLRARARGWRLAVAERSVVEHRGGATAGRPGDPRSLEADRLLVRASGRFLGRHTGWRLVIAAPARLVSMLRSRLRDGRRSGLFKLGGDFIAGVASGLRARRATQMPG